MEVSGRKIGFGSSCAHAQEGASYWSVDSLSSGSSACDFDVHCGCGFSIDLERGTNFQDPRAK